MKNLTISLDEKLLEAAKSYAARQGVSLNRFVRELIQRTVSPGDRPTMDDFFRLSEELQGNSRGWKWNREEIYEG